MPAIAFLKQQIIRQTYFITQQNINVNTNYYQLYTMNKRRITARKSSPISSYQKQRPLTDINQGNLIEKETDPKFCLLQLDQVQYQQNFVPYAKKTHSANGWFEESHQNNYFSAKSKTMAFKGQDLINMFINNIENADDFAQKNCPKEQKQHKRIIKTPMRNSYNLRHLKNDESNNCTWNNSMIPKLKNILKKLESPEKQNKNQSKIITQKQKQNLLIQTIKKRSIYKVSDIVMGKASFLPNQCNSFLNSHQPKRFLKTASCKKRSHIFKVIETPQNFQSIKLFKSSQKFTKKRETNYSSQGYAKNSLCLNKKQSVKQMQQIQAIKREQRNSRTLKNILF